jgi:hypothetical protein
MTSKRDDIASTLREWSVQAKLPETRESTVRMRAVNGLAIAADEIERLRAELVTKADELAATVREIRKVEDERDEARRELCRRNRQPCPQDDEVIQLALRIYAEERGWDCFKENKR